MNTRPLPSRRFLLPAKLRLLGVALLFGSSLPAHANPYVDYLNDWLATGPSLPAMPTGSALTSAWSYPGIARDMEKRVWGVTHPLSTLNSTQKSALQTQIQTEMNYLLGQKTSARWWSESSTILGDSNVDRFVLSEVMDALNRLKTAGVLASDTTTWLTNTRDAVDFQFNHYGQKTTFDWATKVAGSYPNMDAAYTLIMGAAGKAYTTGNYASYTSSAQSFALSLKNMVQSDGTIPYMATTGAAIGYTNIVIDWLGRYRTITADPNANAALVAMKNYYPKQLVTPGISEITSTPWWKHATQPLVETCGAVDLIASLTADPLNAYYGTTLWNLGYFDSSFAVTNADYWQAVTPATPRDRITAPDTDIAGFRGRFNQFAWVGVLNPGQDAFAGATLSTSNFVSNPGYESTDLYSYYTYSGAPTFVADSTVSHSGARSLKISGTSADRGSATMPRIGIIAGRHYRFTVWYQTSSTMPNTAVVARAQLYTQANTQIVWNTSWIQDSTGENPVPAGGSLNMTATSTSVGGWKSMTLAFLAPAGAVDLNLELFTWLGNGSVWYDDASVVDLDSNGAPVGLDSSLVMVTPEVGLTGTSDSVPLMSQAAYISSLTYPKSALVGANRDFSVLSAQYQPQKPSTPVDTPRENAGQAWKVNQSWLFLPDRLVGSVKMNSLTAHTDKYVRTRIRTAPGGLLKQLDATHFTSGGLNLSLLQNDFTGLQVGPAVIADQQTTAPDADEITLTEAGAPRPQSYAAGQSHTVALHGSPAGTPDLDSYTTLTSGTLNGFRAATALNTYDVWFNTGTTSSVLNYTLPASTLQLVSNLYLSGSSSQVITPTAITTGTVNVTVPVGATACVVRSRNLVTNPGMEQLNASGVALNYGYQALQGSPVTAIDSATSHSGNNCIKISGTGSDRGGINATRIPITSGKNYEVTFWYKSDGTINASAILCRLMAWKTTGNTEADKTPWSTAWITGITGGTYALSGNNLNIKANDPTPGTWNSVTIDFNLPSPTIQLNVEYLNWLGNGTVRFDDLSVIQTP